MIKYWIVFLRNSCGIIDVIGVEFYLFVLVKGFIECGYEVLLVCVICKLDEGEL